MSEDELQPIFSRVGGKTKLSKRIIEMMPEHETYIEPFVGGGSIFFRKPLVKNNVINDKQTLLQQFLFL